jgi:hypothetical protein
VKVTVGIMAAVGQRAPGQWEVVAQARPPDV